MIFSFKKARFFSSFLFIISTSLIAQPNRINTKFLTGRFNYRNDTSFVEVPRRYADSEVYLKKETYRAFVKMQKAALKDGVTLSIVSGTRSFYDQKDKWETKWWSAEFAGIKNPEQRVIRLLRWWAMPGTSRHHWGTDMDLNNIKLRYFKTERGKKMYDWMSKNAHKYGFYQPFSANRISGYQEEKWHWSYAPLSRIYLREYLKKVKYSDISGFKGSKEAEGLQVIKNWVSAVNPACR